MKLLWQVGKGVLVLVLVGYGWAYGACDAALLQKLLERDFTKAEILQLCGSGPPSPPAAGRQEATETPGSPLPASPPGRANPPLAPAVPVGLEVEPPKPPASHPDAPQGVTAAPTSQSSSESQRPAAPGAPAPPPAEAPETTVPDPRPQQALRSQAETRATGQRDLTLYHDRLIGTRSIRAARLQVVPTTQQVMVEIEIFERAGAESTREYETTSAVPHLAYDPTSRTILYTASDDAPRIVCGQMVTRRAVLGVWEDVVFTDNCWLTVTTTETGRGFGRRTYGTVVLHVREPVRADQ